MYGIFSSLMLPKGQNDPIKVEYKTVSRSPATLGLGFDPTAVEPESGFKPIVESQGGSIPTLAFSVMDSASIDIDTPVSPSLYEQDYLRRRQDILDQIQIQAYKEAMVKTSFSIF